MINLKNLHNLIKKELIKAKIPDNEAKIEAGILIEHFFNVKNKDLFINPEIEAGEDKLKELNRLIKMRTEAKLPVQYLINKAWFMGEEFYVDENVLIPRPETELLVEEVLRNCKQKENSLKIIDIGTGSGCIAIMLAKNLPKCEITASDISLDALKVAELNAKKLGAEDKIKFIHSDIFKNIEGNFDIIVSNPPYIPEKDRESLQTEVKSHEPSLALFVEDDEGVSFYKKLCTEAEFRLNKGGLLAVEVGFGQAGTVKNIFSKNDFKNLSIIKDMSGIERIVKGSR